ncbi:hypothetical protein D9758_005078 [Tetrapyrgos nigripes]|uniref:Cytochrome P450 n=1 Tax=Tetrapyrgos nigripes TaxID=182062 RepID=A0A8H5GW26_9AGAR|nr:hypothetical protein D9758_005078 [Tetrapyrgos nigripes]
MCPRGIPLLGNALQLPTVKPWHTLAKWKKSYGSIVYLNMAGQPMVILNTKKTVEDLLDQRTSKYSARPHFIVANIMTGGFNFVLMSGGERWRKMRRASDNALGLKHTVNYHSIQRNEAVFMAHSLLGDPDNWRFHVERTSSSVALSLMYDSPLIQSFQDPSLLWMNSYIEKISAALMPGAFLVEHLPRSLSKWRRYAEKSFEENNVYFEKKFQNIKNQVKIKEIANCLIRSVPGLQDFSTLLLQRLSVKSTFSQWRNVPAHIILDVDGNYDDMTRAQEELDKVIGRSRLPSFADLKHLPYIHAIVKERQGQAHPVHGDMSPMMHTVTVVDTPTAVDSRTKRAINLARDIGARPSGETVATLEDVVMSHPDLSSFTPLTPAPRPKRTLMERIYWNNLQSSSDGWGCNDNWNDAFTHSIGTQTGSDADMECAQEEDASWNEDTLVNTSELGSVFGSTMAESGVKEAQDIRTPVPLIDRLASDPAADILQCGIHLGERFQNPKDSLHIYGEPLRAALNTVAPTGTLSLVQHIAAVRSEMQNGSLPAHPSGMTTQSLLSSRVASPTPGTTSTGWEWLTPHLKNEDGRYDELLDWQRDATIGLGGMEMTEELPSRVPTPSSMPELRSMSPSLSETSDLEYMSTPPSLSRMSLPTSPVEDTWSDGIPSPRPSTPAMVTVNAANNYGWSLDSEVSGMDNGYLRSYE